MSNISWTNETRRLRELKPQEDNPREITKAQAERLVKSFDEFNQVEALAVNPDGTILNGHQRYFVLLAAYDDLDYVVDVRVPSRPLTRKEWQKLTVLLHEGTTGTWNWDGLAEWEGVGVAELLDWGFEPGALGIAATDDEWSLAMGGLTDEDRAPFQQMTFTLHDSQVEQVKAAMGVSKGLGGFDTENENSNGNALARICETFLTDYGTG